MRDDHDFNINFVSLIEKQRFLYDYTCAEYSNKSEQDRAWKSVAKEVSESVADCKERWKNLRACYSRHLKSIKFPSGSGVRYKKPYYLAEFLTFLKPFTKTRKQSGIVSDLLSQSTAKVEEEEDEDGRMEYSSPTQLEETEQINEQLDAQFSPDANISSPCNGEQLCFVDLKENFSRPASKMRKTKSTISIEDVNKSTIDFFNSRKRSKSNENETENPDLSFLKSLLPDMEEMSSEQKRSFKIGALTLAQDILSGKR